MSKVNLPEIGDRIEIDAPNHMNSDSRKAYVSQVMDIIDEDNYLVATPIVNNVLAPLPMGEIIVVQYAKKDSGVFLFKAKVVNRKNDSNLSFMQIEKIGTISKTQRRDFFRLEILLNVSISYKDNDDKDKVLSALAKDISGGGIRVIAKEAIEMDKVVNLNIDTKKDPIAVEGKIVRCSPYQVGDYDIGILFDNIDESVRTKIISFIFEEQRKLRKKGLI